MNKEKIIRHTADFIKKKFDGEGTGHDWYHIERVWKMARMMARKEKADTFIVELGALLHDIADWKFHDDENAGGEAAEQWLKKQAADSQTIEKVKYIVQNVSYKGGSNKQRMATLEGMIVQDADRMDALGAIGIARAFAYGGYKQRPIYDPRVKPKIYRSIKELKNSKRIHTTINHFYEKILLLKDQMNTATGKKLAKQRHLVVKNYLKEFYKEWKVQK